MENEVELLKDWPLYSPDHELSDNIWIYLKKIYSEYYLHIVDDRRRPEVLKRHTEDTAMYYWKLIPDYHFERLVASMARWMEEVMKARAWYIKY